MEAGPLLDQMQALLSQRGEERHKVLKEAGLPDKALLNFCAKLNSQASKIGSSDIEALRTYGFSEQQILEAVLLVGWAKFANTVAFGLGTVPDFHNRRIAEELGKARAAHQETHVPVIG